MNKSAPRVVVAMLGARMHYAVPRILHQIGCLEHLYTDTYIGNKPSLEWFLRSLLGRAQSEPLRRLAGRNDSVIPGEKVTSFDLLGIRYVLARRLARGAISSVATFETFGQRFTSAVVRKGFGTADTVWGFNTASLGMFKAARAKGMTCFLEQTILPSRLEQQLLSEVADECRDWQPDFHIDNVQLQHLEQAEWELADTVVVGSQFVADGLEACGVARERIRVVPYGIDPVRFRPSQEPFRIERRPLKLLFVGEVGLRKGVPYLLQALDLIPPGLVETKLVGSITLDRDRLARYGDSTKFLGPLPRTEMPALFRWADAFVLPSIVEGSATVTYEALLSGVPVITTPNSGSIVEDGVSGQIVPVRDCRALADSIQAYAEDRDLLNQHRVGVRKVSHAADISRYASDLASLLIGSTQ